MDKNESELPNHYRYQRKYGYEDEETGEVKSIELIEFVAVRETPGGYWIKEKKYVDYGFMKEKFVLKDSNKRFAYPTKEEAFESFRIRTRKSVYHSLRALNNAVSFVNIVNKSELSNDKIEFDKLIVTLLD